MNLKIELEPGESVLFEDGVEGSKRPMVLGVTNQAVYFTREQHFAKESWRLERIPIPTVTQVYVAKETRIVPWFIAIVIFTFGLVSELAIAWNRLSKAPGNEGNPLALRLYRCGHHDSVCWPGKTYPRSPSREKAL